MSVEIRNNCSRELRARRQTRDWIKASLVPAKQLFTPEIKHYLKTWLVRRRNNPYPTKQEKTRLAIDTGLTYIQVSNWFANWRRKLKNRGHQLGSKTWTSLIKTYNNTVQGNVELFSLSSNDSIWNESAAKEFDSTYRQAANKRRKRWKSNENANTRAVKPLVGAKETSAYLRVNNDCSPMHQDDSLKHQREELDAAEALTTLSMAARSRIC